METALDLLDMTPVTVNGEAREVPWGLTVLGFVESLGRHPRTVAVEYNGSILPRADYERTVLASGDRLEIVHFVQGG